MNWIRPSIYYLTVHQTVRLLVHFLTFVNTFLARNRYIVLGFTIEQSLFEIKCEEFTILLQGRKNTFY